MRRSLKSQKNR